jgi:hypothetical protein
MKHIGFTLLLGLFGIQSALAQKEKAEKNEKAENAVKAVINRFFEGIEKGDTSLIWGACTKEAVLQTFMADKEGKMSVHTEDFVEFVAFIGTPSTNKYKEVIEFEAVHTERSLASAWTPYVFYLNGKISHCGTNSFQLVKTSEGWKIQYIIDTRRKTGCQ